MLNNFWYACESSLGVTNKPKQIVMLNQRFVLYRNSQGQVVALKDQCSHRGAALSLGWLEADCIRCPYHGWKFQADGKCVEIPANAPEVTITKKACVNTYAVQEKYGFIWLFYGDLPPQERPPIPPLAEFDDPAWHHFYLDFRVNTHYTRVLENSLDMSHLPIVHANTIGSGFAENPRIEDYKVQAEDWGVSAEVNYYNHTKPKGLFSHFFRKKQSEVNSKITFYLPNITRVESGSGGVKIINYAIHLPVDDNTTISKRILLRRFFRYAWADSLFINYYNKIYTEDKVVSESQYPRVVPTNLAEEIHIASDALQIAYRKLRQKYLAIGSGINSDESELNELNGSKLQSTDVLLVN